MIKLGSDSMKFKINDYIIEYEVIRKDNKNLYFRIYENCKLIIKAPRFITDLEIKNLITKNSSAILKMYENALQRKERAAHIRLPEALRGYSER